MDILGVSKKRVIVFEKNRVLFVPLKLDGDWIEHIELNSEKSNLVVELLNRVAKPS